MAYYTEKMIVGLFVFLTAYFGYPHALKTSNPALYLAIAVVIVHALAHEYIAPAIVNALM